MSEESEKSGKIDRDVGGVPSPRVGDRDATGVTNVMRDEGVAPPSEAVAPRGLGPRQWRQIALITVGAVALYVGFRVLPPGSDLNHIDFRTGGSPGSLEMCDPSNPQFIPVMAVRSPVSMTVTTETSVPAQAGTTGKSSQAAAGREVRGVARLVTASGKPIGPVDLRVVHTRKLHLLVVDPTLSDYQHLHPEPGARDGEWAFAFTPKRGGVYRVFADFTPTATGRGLYAGADLLVEGSEDKRAGGRDASGVATVLRGEGTPPATEAETEMEADADVGAPPYRVIRDGFVFSLAIAGGVLEAGKPADLVFTIVGEDGGDVPLQPVMDAYAHMVAFDEARSGFAHLHPKEADLSHAPDARAPQLTFKITIPQRGRYVIWAQVNLSREDVFVAFPVEVK